jgi:hypothetical protein
VLDAEDLTAVERDWLGWWRALLAFKVAEHRNPPPEEFGDDWQRRAAQMADQRDAAGGPVDDLAAAERVSGDQDAADQALRHRDVGWGFIGGHPRVGQGLFGWPPDRDPFP